MSIGDRVTYAGRVYVLRGHDPMSVPERQAEIVDEATGARRVVPLAALVPLPPGPEGLTPAA